MLFYSLTLTHPLLCSFSLFLFFFLFLLLFLYFSLSLSPPFSLSLSLFLSLSLSLFLSLSLPLPLLSFTLFPPHGCLPLPEVNPLSAWTLPATLPSPPHSVTQGSAVKGEAPLCLSLLTGANLLVFSLFPFLGHAGRDNKQGSQCGRVLYLLLSHSYGLCC